MKLILQIAVIALLAFGTTLPLSAENGQILLAEKKAVDKDSPKANEEQPSEESEEEESAEGSPEEGSPEEESTQDSDTVIESLTIQHHVKGEALPEQTVDADLFVVLKTLKESLLAQLEKNGKPLAMDTQVNILLSEDWGDVGKLPPLSIKTTVDEQGQGKSDFTLPSFKQEASSEQGEQQEKAIIHWKGLQGQLSFMDKFEHLKGTAQVEGFQIVENKNMMELGKTTLSGELDTDLVPINLNFNLPSFKFNHEEDKLQFDVKGIVFDGQTETKDGLSLSRGHLETSQINFKQEGSESKLSGFELKGHSELQGDVVRYILDSKIGQLMLPEESMGERLDMSYASQLEFRRLDAKVIAEIQKTARELREQQLAGSASAEMLGMAMMGKIMESLPKLLAKSPEFALTGLNLKAEQGTIQGKATIGINGKKAATLKDMNELITAIQAQADFSITKALLEKLMASLVYEELAGEETDGKKPDKSALQKKAKTASQERIKEYLTKKYLVEADNDYQLVVTLQDGKMTLNGQVTELSELFASSPPSGTESGETEGETEGETDEKAPKEK